jgi:membrane protease YdiL (CAAX protease family)
MRGGWRDSLWFAAIELVLFIAVFEAGSYNYLPVSHTPWLFLLCWALLRLRGKRWRDVGFRLSDSWPFTIAVGAIAGVALSLHELIVLEPLVRQWTGGSPDLSLIKEITSSWQNLALLIAASWVLAAFGEEMVWRGFAMTRVAEVLGGNAGAWFVSLVGVSAIFGIAHSYQDLSGVIITAVGGVTYGLLYLLSGRCLAIPIVAHGVQNTCDLMLICWGGIIPGT